MPPHTSTTELTAPLYARLTMRRSVQPGLRTRIDHRVAAAFRYGRSAVSHHVRQGLCSICDGRAIFVQVGPSERENNVCLRCRSNARARAVFSVLSTAEPNWRDLEIFEPSPTGRASAAVAASCHSYTAAVFRPGHPLGSAIDGVRNESLEELTFPTASLDIVLTQDVLEHVFQPARVFAEIARVLRPGGAHVFTVPYHSDLEHSRVRATRGPSGEVRRMMPAEYHADPFDTAGSLVTMDWGRDLPHIADEAGKTTTVLDWVVPGNPKISPISVFVSRRTVPSR